MPDKKLTAERVGAALREIKAACGPEPPEPPEIEWDGISPIDGEQVTRRFRLWNVDYALTSTACYRVRAKSESA